MKTALSVFLALIVLSATTRPSLAAQNVPSQPQRTTFCALAASPQAYDKQLVQLDALITYGFENFHLVDPSCPSPPERFSVWVTFGGRTSSNAMYCCPGEGGQTRTENLKIDEIEVPLADDNVFRQFTALLRNERDTMVRATLIGRFFAGEELPGWSGRAGFGHFGCCSLFAIQQVLKFEPHTRRDLDYTSEAGFYEGIGCNAYTSRFLRTMSFIDRNLVEEVIEEQRMVDSGARAWATSDPMRVAVESLRPFYPNAAPVLRRVKTSTSREVFRWRNGKTSFTVVVTRPYWLSFFAKSSAIAWVATAIQEAECR